MIRLDLEYFFAFQSSDANFCAHELPWKRSIETMKNTLCGDAIHEERSSVEACRHGLDDDIT